MNVFSSASSRSWLGKPRLLIFFCLALCYALVLTIPHFFHLSGLFPLTFNSMLDHLLRGEFDVDPAVVGPEGFARDGRVYAYWGVLPAILRLPVTILPNWRHLDFTVPYCIAALTLMIAVKLWTARFVLEHRPDIPRSLGLAIYVTIVFAGAQTTFLRFSLYQEVCLWAGLFGAVFVSAAIVAQHTGLGERQRLIMAAAVGAALLTRVSTGIGLVAAFGLLLSVEAIRKRADWQDQIRKSLVPMVVLAAAGLLTAWVNYNRWGNPLTFADYQHYIFNINFPDRLERTANYGLFNLERIPFGFVYYFFPVWVLHGSDGSLLFDATRSRLIDSAELPPSSFFLTDPLLLFLGGVAVVRWLTRRDAEAAQGAAVAAGLAISALLMLSAISMCFRYRMDFYPVMEFLAFSGLAMVKPAMWAARPRLIWTLAAISVVSSITVGMAYVAGQFGPGEQLIEHGVGQYYLGRLGLR